MPTFYKFSLFKENCDENVKNDDENFFSGKRPSSNCISYSLINPDVQ